MEVLHPNPVNFSGSHSMASSFPTSNAQTFPSTFNNNYVPFFNNSTQSNFHFPANPSQATIPTSYGVFPSPNPTNIYYVNSAPQNNNVFFANNVSWNFSATDGRRGIKRKSYDVDPGVPSSPHQKKTRSWYDYPDSDLHELNSDHTSTASDESSKQIILYQGPSSSNPNNNSNNNFLKTLFESNPINFFAQDHIIDPETKKALIPVKPAILSVWDVPDDSEPERELIKSPRIVELTEDDLDTGEEHIRQIPTIIEADAKPNSNKWDGSPVPSVDSNETPTVVFPITPPSSPSRPRTCTPYDEEPEEDEELIVDEDNNVIRIKPKSEVVIEEIHDEPSPAEPEPYQGMDIE